VPGKHRIYFYFYKLIIIDDQCMNYFAINLLDIHISTLLVFKFNFIILANSTRPSTMFSNRQQQNSPNLLHQVISSSGTIVLPTPSVAVNINSIAMNCNNNSAVTSVTTILTVSTVCIELNLKS